MYDLAEACGVSNQVSIQQLRLQQPVDRVQNTTLGGSLIIRGDQFSTSGPSWIDMIYFLGGVPDLGGGCMLDGQMEDGIINSPLKRNTPPAFQPWNEESHMHESVRDGIAALRAVSHVHAQLTRFEVAVLETD